jgi:hypothetical protein
MKMPIEFVICHSMCETCLQAEVPWGMKRDLNVLAVLQMLATCLPLKLAMCYRAGFARVRAWPCMGILWDHSLLRKTVKTGRPQAS